jgi:CubicO group peptidase (beta-lactamase class C family)
MSVPHGAGALISTPGDLVKFAHALFSNKLISAASLAEMKKTSEGYGLGMFENKFGTAIGYGHTGGIDGFTSQLVYFPADGTAVAYCSNGSGYENEKIVGSAYDVMNGKKIEMPNFKTIAVPESELDAVLGTYSSPGFPLKVTFTKNDGTLVAQATGQGAFPLEAVAKNKFKFDPAGVVVEFNPEKGTMTLYQGGRTVEFTREK